MIYGIKVVVTYLLGTDIGGRNFAVYPGDTFVVSYPRSGNTWTRFLIGNLVHPDGKVSFSNIEKLIPDTSRQSNKTLKRTPRPRLIKTHEYFDHRYPKTIYIVRDPRDVVLSLYNFQRKYRHYEDSYPLERYVDDFVSRRLSSESWGTWGENVASWFYTCKDKDTFLLLRYEDMVKHTAAELARIAVFLGIDPEPGRLQNAIERSSRDRMRELEKLESEQWVVTRGKRTDIPFVGKEKPEGWRNSLPEPCIRQIESAWGELMTTLGYELVTRPEAQNTRVERFSSI
jgi:hypothetical protein